MPRLRMRRALVLLALLAKETQPAAWSNRFLRLERQVGVGDVLASRKVPSLVVCGSFCEASACAGFNVEEEADGGLSCTSLATVANVTADNSTNFYCAGCYMKGEKCSTDDHCTFLTERAYCEPTNGTCACVSWCMDDGPDCVPRPVDLGGQCLMDEQCLAVSPYTFCNAGVCSCMPDLFQDGGRCRYDYAEQGFQSYNGRWVNMKPGTALGISWNDAQAFCQGLRSSMMRPLSSAEWNWMYSQAKAILNVGILLGVNDKASEGQFVWNDGTPVSGDPAIVWTLGMEGYGNTFLSQCVGITWPLITNPIAGVIVCEVPMPTFAVFCESSGDLA